MSLNLYNLIASLPVLSEENSLGTKFLSNCKRLLSTSEYELLSKCNLHSNDEVITALSNWQQVRDDFHDQLNFLRSQKYNLDYERKGVSKVSDKLQEVFRIGDPLKLDEFIFKHYVDLLNRLQESFQFTFDWLVYYYLKLQLFEVQRDNKAKQISIDQLINAKVSEAGHE